MKLLIVDSHPIELEGCRRIFQGDPDVTMLDARSIAEARAFLEAQMFDVILMDVSLPDGSGLDFAEEITSRNPKHNVVLFAPGQSPALIAHAINRGVRAYVSKSSDPSALKEAIASAATGKPWLDPELIQPVAIARLSQRNATLLSAREAEVLRLAAEGLSMAEIAAALSISYKTATVAAGTLRTKLGADSFPALVHIAAEFRLI
jgi:DNA-binding NarL/FixJ family response regulator